MLSRLRGVTARFITTTAARTTATSPASTTPYPFSKTALLPTSVHPKDAPLQKLKQGKGLMPYLQRTLYSPGKAEMMHALFSRRSPSQLKVGSIITVLNEQAPTTFTGVLIAIRRRGPDSSFTLRNILNRTGIEMQFFPNAPGVKEVKVIRSPPKGRMRRAKLYYLRNSPEKMSMLAGGKNK
jgi:large subunit ribosomal protein L19